MELSITKTNELLGANVLDIFMEVFYPLDSAEWYQALAVYYTTSSVDITAAEH